MSKLILSNDEECCGASFEKNNISLLGLITLSIPIFFALFIIKVITLNQYKNKTFLVLYRSNNDLIKNFKLLNNLRCKLSGRVMRASPCLGNWIFNYLNHFILAIPWLLILIIAVKILI